MDIKIFGRNIAAVSLIEIMMIFAIIGVVTVASAGLSKPKYEYMQRIRLYTALSELEAAAKILTKEGHIDFTTDINTCPHRNYSTNNVCTDYHSKYPDRNNQLPKVSMRNTDTVTDPGLNDTAYANLGTSTEKRQFLYLQNGLCQRLSKIFNLSDANINCSDTTDAAGLIDSSDNYPTNFLNIAPQLYLPNGQVIYIDKNLYTDIRRVGDTTQRLTVNIVPAMNDLEYDLGANPNFSDAILTDNYIRNPNEMRLAGAKTTIESVPNHADINVFRYLEQMWSKNKDYFLIYVDVDCKKIGNDNQCGKDRLNEDVFAFRMYRDGTVIPDYASGFPRNALTAKVMVKDRNDMYGRYQTYANYNYAYANMPLNYAKCAANILGTYASNIDHDYTGMCTFDDGTVKPLNDCVITSINGVSGSETYCKAVLNKPSFLAK